MNYLINDVGTSNIVTVQRGELKLYDEIYNPYMVEYEEEYIFCNSPREVSRNIMNDDAIITTYFELSPASNLIIRTNYVFLEVFGDIGALFGTF